MKGFLVLLLISGAFAMSEEVPPQKKSTQNSIQYYIFQKAAFEDCFKNIQCTTNFNLMHQLIENNLLTFDQKTKVLEYSSKFDSQRNNFTNHLLLRTLVQKKFPLNENAWNNFLEFCQKSSEINGFNQGTIQIFLKNASDNQLQQLKDIAGTRLNELVRDEYQKRKIN